MEYKIVNKMTGNGSVDYYFDLPQGWRVVSVLDKKKARNGDYYILTLLIERDARNLPLTELR
jgi:hypothetical protein